MYRLILIFLLVINCMIDRRSFVNVLNHLNVVEYFLPSFVILLLDVILCNPDIKQGISFFLPCFYLPASFNEANS